MNGIIVVTEKQHTATLDLKYLGFRLLFNMSAFTWFDIPAANRFRVGLFLLLLISVSCKHDPVLPPLPGDVSYSKDIAPIMKRSCAYQGCHAQSNNINFPLEKYSDLINFGQVVPFKPLDSDLYDVIARKYMPLGSNKLSLTDQKLIYDWIVQGAQDN